MLSRVAMQVSVEPAGVLNGVYEGNKFKGHQAQPPLNTVSLLPLGAGPRPDGGARTDRTTQRKRKTFLNRSE